MQIPSKMYKSMHKYSTIVHFYISMKIKVLFHTIKSCTGCASGKDTKINACQI